jgi:hypothetical protein
METDDLKERMRYLNPAALEELSRGLVETARRFLEYERFVESLEFIKAEGKSLPPEVERRVGRSMQAILGDIRTSARLASELADELDDAGVVEPLFQAVASAIERDGPLTVGSVLENGKEVIEAEMERRGMPRELWRWALAYTPGLDVSLRASGGTIEARKGDAVLFSIPGDGAVEPMSILAGFHASSRRTNCTDIIRARVSEAVSLYEQRAAYTALEGVRVFPTGLGPLAIFIVVVIAIGATLFVVGLVLLALCGAGVITSRSTCRIALYLALVGFLIVAAALGGAFVEDQREKDPSG